MKSSLYECDARANVDLCTPLRYNRFVVNIAETAKKNDGILTQLASLILKNKIQSGTEITQNELAQSLGVSRIPVREALLILEYTGLIEKLPNQHVRIAAIDASYFEEIFELALEIELNILYKNCRDFIFSDELSFHKNVIRLSANAFIRKTLNSVLEIFISFALTDPLRSCAIDDLKKIIAEIKSGEKDNAKAMFAFYFNGLAASAWHIRNNRHDRRS